MVNARPHGDEKRKGPDRGVDGRIDFLEYPGGDVHSILVQVKGGHNVQRGDVATLIGDMQRGFDIGVLVTLTEPTEPMKREAADAGVYIPEDPIGAGHPAFAKVQLLTIREILEQGSRI